VRSTTSKEGLALRKKKERANTTSLLATLELLAPNIGENKRQPGCRCKALRGRAKEELLKDVMYAVRVESRLVAPGAWAQAYTTQAGAGLIAIELKSGKIAHQSPSFQDLTSWIPEEASGNIRVSLMSRDGDYFHSFCQSVVRDAGEPYGETFLDRDNVVGRCVTVCFLTRAPGPPGLRNPEWLLMVRPVKLTLVGVQPRQLAGESASAGSRLPFFGKARIPEAIGVFTADLSGGTPSQWTVQAAHIRNLLDLEVASGTYDLEVGNIKPLELLAMLFNFEISKEGGGGASVFSRAAAHLEYAATSALNIAQRSASWLTRKALRFTNRWSMRLDEDDAVSISGSVLFKLFGGLSTSFQHDFVGGKVGFSHGGLDLFHFVADPRVPLDGNLRATVIRIAPTKTGGDPGQVARIASSKTKGEFDRQGPLVISHTWGGGNLEIFCKKLCVDSKGKQMASEDDVSQLFENLKISPGAGLISDGPVTICVGQSDV
jgi:hypothetical protein